MTKLFCILALGAGLALVSCQQKEPVAPTPEESVAEPVTVTVTAGIADDASTKSAVVVNGTNNQLTFTSGDRLYIFGRVTGVAKVIIGYLNIVGTPAPGATSASFTGTYGTDFIAYKWNYTDQRYYGEPHTFATEDILSECYNIQAFLVHKDGSSFNNDACFPNQNEYVLPQYDNYVAATVEELMTQCMPVAGPYDNTNKSFSLSVIDKDMYGDDIFIPIYKCEITDLTPDETYDIFYHYRNDSFSINNEVSFQWTADSYGKASFAFLANMPIAANSDPLIQCLGFASPSNLFDCKFVDLGTRTLDSKIYNISKSAVDFMNIPQITGIDPGYPFNDWDAHVCSFNCFEYGPALDFSLSNPASDVCFYICNQSEASVSLSDLTVTYSSDLVQSSFLHFDLDATIEILGNNTITTSYLYAIDSSYGNIKLSGDGTLTITVYTNDPDNAHYCGLYSQNYDENNNSYVEDVIDVSSLLAANDHTVVTRLAASGTDEKGQYYTWLYMVSQN